MANPNFVGVLSGLAAAGIVSAAMLWPENAFSGTSVSTQSNSESKPSSDQAANGNSIVAQSTAISKPMTLVWADILEQEPNPQVVTDANLRKRIQETGLPWRVQDKVSGIEMLLVPQGKFEMGMSSGDRDALANEKPDH